MSYATAADLIARFDANTIADLASDTGEPAGDISAAPRVLTALEDASGRVDAACMVSDLYTAADLAALTGNGLALLKRIVCDIALANLLGARPEKYGTEFFKAIDERAEEYLERLRKGARLFPIQAQKDAGLPSVDGPSAVDIDEDHLNLVTSRTHNFYPHAARRLPFGRGA